MWFLMIDRWSKNRANLVSWIKANHPELDGFLIDQSPQGSFELFKSY